MGVIGFGTLYWTYTRNPKGAPEELGKQQAKARAGQRSESGLEALEKEAKNTSGKIWDLGHDTEGKGDP